MSVLRNRPKGVRGASFGLGLCVFALIPNEIGYQDIASLLARQPGVAERWQKRVVASTVSSIQVATFSFARPIGTSRDPAFEPASFGGDSFDPLRVLKRNPIMRPPQRYQAEDFPVVDRTVKGDRLAVHAHEPVPSALPTIDEEAPESGPETPKDDTFPSHTPAKGAKTAGADGAHESLDPELAEALNAPPLVQYDAGAQLGTTPRHPEGEALDTSQAAGAVEPAPARDGFSVKTASLFFGSASLGASAEAMERWLPGEEPMIVVPGVSDPDLKTASLAAEAAPIGGVSIAGKGEVNTGEQRVKTPAERLGLFDEKAREKQEKCLANAVYFEARGEAVRGQIAVAQVVMNRVFSGFYPTTVCGVVYQNANRRLACQFTFACDGIPDVVREPDMWDRARKIAKATLDGRLWLPEVAKSTHYHAYWVRPSWVHEMRKMYKTGVHTFYRPRAWGDGKDAPSWGTQAQTAEISERLAAVKP